jgi:hypothetical protein
VASQSRSRASCYGIIGTLVNPAVRASDWWHICTYASRASAAALSAVLRTTTLPYGNMQISVTCPSETPQPIKMKFCTIDNVGEVTRYYKTSWNRLAGGGSTDKWNITSKTVLTFPYFIPYLTFFSRKPLQLKRLNRFARMMAQTTRFVVRKCLWGSHWYGITSRGQNPQKPYILEPGCQISSQINTFE